MQRSCINIPKQIPLRTLHLHSAQQRFWLLHLVLPILLVILMVFIYPYTGLDAWLIRPFYDTQTLVFPLKNDGFLENIMHQGFKNLMIVVSLITFSLWLFGLKIWQSKRTSRAKTTWIHTYHNQFLWVFVAMIFATSIISVLKHFSNHACPWSLLIYGGRQPLISLFGNLPAGAVAGHCFPGGHASAGFALMAFYFGFRDTLPKFAKIALLIGLVFGTTMGYAQMMRGAHFMSHNLWTALIVWVMLLTQYLIWKPKSAS